MPKIKPIQQIASFESPTIGACNRATTGLCQFHLVILRPASSGQFFGVIFGSDQSLTVSGAHECSRHHDLELSLQ